MTHDNAEELVLDDFGPRLHRLRRSNGMTRAQLARSSGLSRRRVASLERGKASISAADISALADACGVDVDALTRPEFRFAGACENLTAGADELRGEAATDALLREYVSMVVELREFRELSAAGLRRDDLSELANALGGTPAAIEARLVQLLGADKEQAWRVCTAISPSLGTTP
jgi:transcriptional regulator with XRE-family HTH domain